MRSSRSGFYRQRDGRERLWFSPAAVEVMMEDELRKRNLFPTEEQPSVNVEGFVQSLGVRMDQYAQLEATVLGLTEFYRDQPPKIFINRDLTGAIDDDGTPPGILGRWRATLAHEASHVVMHSVLFEVNDDQELLFHTEAEPESRQLMRCFKKNVLFRGGTTDWREVQANMGMAALLMPPSLLRTIARNIISQHKLPAEVLTAGSSAAALLSSKTAALFDVSKQAAAIRLETLGILAPAGQPWLIHDS